jgi:hypothetical protein
VPKPQRKLPGEQDIEGRQIAVPHAFHRQESGRETLADFSLRLLPAWRQVARQELFRRSATRLKFATGTGFISLP